MTKPFASSFSKIFIIYAILNLALRLIFTAWQYQDIDFLSAGIYFAFLVGLFFDFITLCYIYTPASLYYIFIPNRIFNSKIQQNSNKVFYFIFLYSIIFGSFSEIVFWQEFQTRFNFITVDYLVYTTEVINNIVESYPIFWLLFIILILAAAIYYFTNKKIISPKFENFTKRLSCSLIVPLLALIAFLAIDGSKMTRISENNYVNEIAANGTYQLFSAYRNNKVNYNQLYETIDYNQALKTLRADILVQEKNSKFLNDKDIERQIFAKGAEKRYNVIFVTIESFSADFMKYFGNKNNITPNFDKLAQEGLFFTNLKAVGTRTVRGLEALTLSAPPTPGNSIVRRMYNENLFTIATPFQNRNYDTRFIYGGYGYFDNMNYFYENNGFEIVDRATFTKDEINFENVWGVSDEDLFEKTIAKADESYAKNKPFFNFVMTTSNHRPYTYPDGRIDIPSKTNRNGAVKYTDYAIKKLIDEARIKAWFNNTIFVFVADHCAGSAGNTDVPLWRYQIPAIFYAPKIIKPRVFAHNLSQIDIAPTLIGLLNFNYKSKFFGADVLNNEKSFANRAFVSTYLDVGYYKNDKLYLLKPKKENKVFDVKIEKFGDNGSKEMLTKDYNQGDLDLTISYYQIANYFYENGLMKR